MSEPVSPLRSPIFTSANFKKVLPDFKPRLNPLYGNTDLSKHIVTIGGGHTSTAAFAMNHFSP